MAQGHIRKRIRENGEVSYQVVVEVEKDPLSGKRTRVYQTIHGTRRQANEALQALKNKVDTGQPASESALKLKDWLHQWLDTYLPNIEATTRAGYRERIDSCIVPILGHIPLKELKPANVQAWINALSSKGLSPKTIKNAFHNIDAALEKAVVLKMIAANPCTGTVLPKLVKPDFDVFDTDEMIHLLEISKGTDMYTICLLAGIFGLRRGELVALKWSDIDFENAVLHVRRNTVMAEGQLITKAPKSSAGIRDISLGQHVLVELQKAHAQYMSNKLLYGAAFHDTDLVVCQENGKGYRPDSITQKWERFVRKNHLRPIRFHDLRHSCATTMIEADIDLKTIQKQLGHADVSITLGIYAHSTKSMNRRAADRMDGILFSQQNDA